MLRAALTLLCATLTCVAPLAAQPIADTLAVVGGDVVYADHFEESYAARLVRTGEADTRLARRAHLDDLIDAYLLAAHAEQTELEPPGLADALELERLRAARDAYFEHALIDSLAQPTDADLRRAFARDQQQVVARHLFFASQAEAQAAHARLEAGTPFLDLAQAHYDAPGDSLAGRIGPVGYFGAVDPALAHALFALPQGAYSAPVRSRAGWHVLSAERWIVNPVLAEDGYQERRSSIAGQWRERARLVAGDAFVRAQMQALDVQVEAPTVRALGALLQSLSDPEPAAVELSGGDGFTPSDAQAVRAAVRAAARPDAVLATYQDGASRRTFTVADYARWLPDLPAAEARARTGASVGRALRNAVFAERGRELGLDARPAVQRHLAHAQHLTRADALRSALRDTSQVLPTDEQARALAQQRGLMDRRDALTVAYRSALFDSYDAAVRARAALSERAPDAPPFDLRTADAHEAPLLRTHLARVALGDTTVVGLSDGRWAVLSVAERASETADPNVLLPQLARALAPYTAEVRLAGRLRAAPDAVRVRADVFERLYRLSDTLSASR